MPRQSRKHAETTSRPPTQDFPFLPYDRLRPGHASLAPGSARSLLLTILGELVLPMGEPVWTSTLLHVLTGLGLEKKSARQAIARAADSEWIVGERFGREVRWAAGAGLRRVVESGSPRVYSLSHPFTDWDGTWLVVVVSIPQSQRSARRPLYAGLTWAGLGNPVAGLWLTPHVERTDEVGSLVRRLGLQDQTVSFVGSVDATGMSEADIVERGWDLSTLRDHYEAVLDAVESLAPPDSDAMLLAHVRMISEWQEFPRTDPQLPEALLPDWIGRRVARRIESLRAQWAPEVRRHFAQIDAAAGS
jgi:phenylacetic acid degradation operon negative regulatory protein